MSVYVFVWYWCKITFLEPFKSGFFWKTSDNTGLIDSTSEVVLQAERNIWIWDNFRLTTQDWNLYGVSKIKKLRVTPRFLAWLIVNEWYDGALIRSRNLLQLDDLWAKN